MFSLDEVDALADASCFCFRGGMMWYVRLIAQYVENRMTQSRAFIQLGCTEIVLQWWWRSIRNVWTDPGVCLCCELRFALALHWRWRHCGKCRSCYRAASPSATPALTTDSCYTITTHHCITPHYTSPASTTFPGLHHQSL